MNRHRYWLNQIAGVVLLAALAAGCTTIAQRPEPAPAPDTEAILEEAIDAANTASREHPCRVIVVIPGDRLATEAVKEMEQNKINGLLVLDNQGRVEGALNLHDLFRAGVV